MAGKRQTRKPHTKSRKGCAECKRRHNKCDEVHPVCSSCTRLSVDCVWPDMTQAATTTSSRQTPTTSPSPQSGPRNFIERLISITAPLPSLDELPGSAFSAEDMQLLHHYSTHTFATFDTGPRSSPMWQHTVVHIGFRHRFVLRGLLAIAALHLATTENPSWLESASLNFTLALAEFRGVLDAGLDAANCVPVFVFATTVVVHAVAVGQTQDARGDPVADAVACFQLVRGVRTTIGPFWDTLVASEVGPIVANGISRDAPGSADDIQALAALVCGECGVANAADRDVCLEAIEHLSRVAVDMRTAPDGADLLGLLFGWGVMVSDRFLELVGERNAVALIVLLHYTALSQHRIDVWWLSRWHRRIRDSVQEEIPVSMKMWIPGDMEGSL